MRAGTAQRPVGLADRDCELARSQLLRWAQARVETALDAVIAMLAVDFANAHLVFGPGAVWLISAAAIAEMIWVTVTMNNASRHTLSLILSKSTYLT